MRALVIRTVLACFLVGSLRAESIEHEPDAIVIGERFVDFLNAWCPDAWCAGDYNHVFLDANFDALKKEWRLSFLSYLHKTQEAPELLSVSARSNFPGRVSTGPFLSHLSECTFPASEPLQLFTFNAALWHMTGFSDALQTMLFDCIDTIEKFYN